MTIGAIGYAFKHYLVNRYFFLLHHRLAGRIFIRHGGIAFLANTNGVHFVPIITCHFQGSFGVYKAAGVFAISKQNNNAGAGNTAAQFGHCTSQPAANGCAIAEHAIFYAIKLCGYRIQIGSKRTKRNALARKSHHSHAVALPCFYKIGRQINTRLQAIRCKIAGQHAATYIETKHNFDTLPGSLLQIGIVYRTGHSHHQQRNGKGAAPIRQAAQSGTPGLGYANALRGAKLDGCGMLLLVFVIVPMP